MITIKDLEMKFCEAITLNKRYMAMKISIPNLNEAYELIVIPNKAFENKLAYYKKSYTDELKLKSFPEIYIKDFAYGNYLREIEEQLTY